MSARADAPQTAILDGRVVDAGGAPVAGIAVALTGDRGEETTSTGADGRFLFAPLPPGDFVVSVAVEGSATLRKAARLEPGGRSTIDFQLQLASTDSIDVIATEALVDPDQPAVVSAIDGDVARELVFATRNYLSVITSLPGVVVRAGGLAESTPTVNGALWQENGFFLDGVDITDTRFGGGGRTVLPTSALTEVRSDASGYGVEYGRAVGGVTGAVTRSGTNVFHGDFLYVAQNPSWRAQSEVAAVDREDHVVSSYELSLGGPVVRDRAWFFAAGADNTTNSLTALSAGEVIDGSLESESILGKLALDASRRHHLTLTGLDALASTPLATTATAERLAASEAERGTSFVTATWSFTATSTSFVEVRGATQRTTSDRKPMALAAIQPGAGPDDPPGNQGTYWDNASGLRWHGSDLPLGPGTLEFPRDQGNATFTWLRELHELVLGADYQEVGWEALNRPPDRYLGRGYDPALPGGFALPEVKRVFIPIDSPVGTSSTFGALFAQDRIDIGDGIRLNVGLRVEEQTHDDDRGREVIASTDLAPRVALVWDVGADGGLLVKSTAGRYATQVPQDFLNQEFATLSNGSSAFDEYLWNPATLRYDRFNRRQLPALRAPVNDVEPYVKDEATAGIEWQMSPVWALDARAIAWKVDAPWSATDQFDANGSVFRLLTNFTAAEREYRGLQVEVTRAHRSGLVVRANYTLSRVDGNSVGSTGGGDDFLEAMTVLDPAAGVPVTTINRDGRLAHDRTHILNLAGAKRWTLGSHGLAVGGWFAFRSGEPWGREEQVALRSSAGTTIFTTRFPEPRDRHELPETYTLDLTAAWEVPIAGRTSGSLRVELVNASDEQEQIDVSRGSSQPIQVPASYQTPREIRLVLGVEF